MYQIKSESKKGEGRAKSCINRAKRVSIFQETEGAPQKDSERDFSSNICILKSSFYIVLKYLAIEINYNICLFEIHERILPGKLPNECVT